MNTRTTQSQFDDSESYFGVCPECGETDGCLNVGPDHWFVCHTHKTKWRGGSDLFAAWRTAEKLLNNYRKIAAEKLLVGYHQVEPQHPTPTSDTDET